MTGYRKSHNLTLMFPKRINRKVLQNLSDPVPNFRVKYIGKEISFSDPPITGNPFSNKMLSIAQYGACVSNVRTYLQKMSY